MCALSRQSASPQYRPSAANLSAHQGIQPRHSRSKSLNSKAYCFPAFVLQPPTPPRPAPPSHSNANTGPPKPVSLHHYYRSRAPTFHGSSLPPTLEETSSRTVTHPAPAPTYAAPWKVPAPYTAKSASPPLRRLMLVNPCVAAHLQKGGSVSVKSADGSKSWRMYLPSGPVLSRAM